MLEKYTTSLVEELSRFLTHWLNIVCDKAKVVCRESEAKEKPFSFEQALALVLCNEEVSSVISLRKRFLQEFVIDVPTSAYEYIDLRITNAINEAYKLINLPLGKSDLSYTNLFHKTESRSMVLDALPDDLFEKFSQFTGKCKWTTSKVVLHKIKHGLVPAESIVIYRIRLIDEENNLRFCLFSNGDDVHFGIVGESLYYSLGDPAVTETNSWLRRIEAFYTMEHFLSPDYEDDREVACHSEYTELNNRCMTAMKLACSLVHPESWMPDQNPYRPNNVWAAMTQDELRRTAFLNIAYGEHMLTKSDRYDVQRFSGISKVNDEYIDVSRKTYRIPNCVHKYHSDSRNYPIGKLRILTMDDIEKSFSIDFGMKRKVGVTDIGK